MQPQPLLITMGDPTGIGPELIIKMLLTGELPPGKLPLKVVGDVAALRKAATIFAVDLKARKLGDSLFELSAGDHKVLLDAVSCLPESSLNYGRPDHHCGKAMAKYVEYAATQCLQGAAAGMVTCPINKGAINAAGYSFPGHTELLAARCNTDSVVMMLAGSSLRVCLVTTHAPYREVPRLLSSEAILTTLRITDMALKKDFALPKPRLAVLALNPHAGENGLFGDEEQRIIAPAIAAAQAEGIAADGPQSADTLFHFAVKGSCDAVVCMYHDQGLIPLKLLHFDDAVNVTLGLPIVRTSVDHGTAYDLAGSGTAGTASLRAAIAMAETMVIARTSCNQGPTPQP